MVDCMKASFISATKTYDGTLKYLTYSYKGYEYMITDHGWYGNGGISESLKYQHEQEQHRIDKMIEERNKPKTNKPSKQFDADEIYKMMGWEE